MSFSDILKDFPDRSLIKEGGQKAAYRISHEEFGDSVLKVGQYSSNRGLERIRREVSTLRDIESDYYPNNYKFEVDEEDKVFIIIEEWINSNTLGETWHNFESTKEKVGLIKEVSNGLNILWEREIVHRDIKPDNILIRPDGRPVIIDLGIARLLDMESLTMTLARRGPCTPIYAAPEQLRNRKSEIDWRTDQFNLGIILVQLFLGGSHPFNPDIVGSGDSTVQNIQNDEWYSKPLESDEMNAVYCLADKLLGNEPYLRFRESDYFFEAIDKCITEYE